MSLVQKSIPVGPVADAAAAVQPSSRHRHLPDALFVVLCLAAVLPGLWMTRGVHWPQDLDGFRDLAIAESILNRGWRADAFYRGELAWYNPLVPAAAAYTSVLSGVDLPRTFVVLGAWLNALAPIAYYICIRVLVGPPVALMATAAFLFLPSRPEAWASATYSPWLFPALAAQVPLYASLASWVITLRKPTVFGAVRTGVLIGVTFLAHTAPAIVLLGVVWFSGFGFPVWPPRWTRARAIALQATTTVVSLIVVALFLAPLVWHYGLRVRNRAPATWSYDPAQPLLWVMGMRFGDVVIVALAVTGLVFILRRAAPVTRAVTLPWGGVVGAALLYALLTEKLTSIPTLVPAYHFLFLLRAWKWLLVAIGGLDVLRRGLPWLRHRVSYGVSTEAALLTLSMLLAVAMYPRYLGRDAFTGARDRALAVGDDTAERQAYAWIQRHTLDSDVFAASDVDGLRIVAPAGRYVVAVQPHFSSPYVDWGRRTTDRDRMLSAFTSGDLGTFDERARRYGVTHLLLRTPKDALDSDAPVPGFCRVFQAGTLSVFATDREGTACLKG